MKLLAVAAIGVTALIGSPTTGAADPVTEAVMKESLRKQCGAFLEDAVSSWRGVQLFRHAAKDVRDKMGKAAIPEQTSDVVNFSEELETLERLQSAKLEIMANYAQIYAAFCK